MYKRAVILAGGKGTRLKPFTVSMPKPLVPVGELPILEIIIRQLAYYGFDSITITVNHMADLIKAFFGDGSKWGVNINYSLEDKPLSTMGPLKLLKDLPENFLVMNGDILTDLNFSDFFENHCLNKNIFTISSYQREQKSEYGVLELNDELKLTGFQEKPKIVYDVSMGIYAVNKQILNIIPEDTAYGFDHLMLELIKRKNYASIEKFSGYWLDIGRPDDYEIASEEFEKQRHIFLNEKK
jgi:NDP-sugar pyrophosphorylase family protein